MLLLKIVLLYFNCNYLIKSCDNCTIIYEYILLNNGWRTSSGTLTTV